MSVRRYWPMLRDLGGIVRAVAAQEGDARKALPYAPEQAARVVSRYHVTQLNGHVLSAQMETPDTRTLRLAFPPSSLPTFQTGQHFSVHVTVDGVDTSRPYTVTSAPDRGDVLEITVKRHPQGRVSPLLVDHLSEGDPIQVSGPDGDDHYNPLRDSDDLVLAAGGSGITAFLTTAERLLVERPQVRITLLYGNRTEADIVFRDRLEALAQAHPQRFRLHLVLSRPGGDWKGAQGHVDAALLQRVLSADDSHGEGLVGKTFFVCGPAAMNRTLPAALHELGVRPNRVHAAAPAPPPPDRLTTLPGWPADVAADASFALTVRGNAGALEARASEPLLVALERGGLQPAASCRTGTCGSCRARVVAGSVFSGPEHTPRPSDAAGGYVNTCVCFPLGDVTLDSV